MRVFVAAPVPTPVIKKMTNLVRGSSIKAVRELKRTLEVTSSNDSPILVSRKDLVVFDRLINYHYNLPDAVYDFETGSRFEDGDDANPTG